MGRVNKTIDGVFVDIVGTGSRIGRYDEFINDGTKLKQSKELKTLVNQYQTLINKHKDSFKTLSDLEEVIMQMRVKENLKDVKLTILREYIYARCTFFRTSTQVKDIRVIVGLTTTLGDDLTKLSKNKKFMDTARIKLQEAMDKEIQSSLSNIKIK